MKTKFQLDLDSKFPLFLYLEIFKFQQKVNFEKKEAPTSLKINLRGYD
jgi:hypothetical protein